MRVELRIRNTDLASVLRNYADRRLRFALSRFGDRVGRVVVTLSKFDGAEQSIAKSCHITAELRPFGQVATREVDPNLYTAIDRAVGRLGRLFASRLGRDGDEVRSQAFRVSRTGEVKKHRKGSGKRPLRLLRTRPSRRFVKNLGTSRNEWQYLAAKRRNPRRK